MVKSLNEKTLPSHCSSTTKPLWLVHNVETSLTPKISSPTTKNGSASHQIDLRVLIPMLRRLNWFAATANESDELAQAEAIETAEVIFKFVAESYLERLTPAVPVGARNQDPRPVVKTSSFLASVAVERVFLKSRHICANLRSSLKEKTIMMALLTKVWIWSGLFEMTAPTEL